MSSEKIDAIDDKSSGQGVDRKISVSVQDAESRRFYSPLYSLLLILRIRFFSEDVHINLGQPGQILKLDKTGLPLVPQPSDDPSDPLNFPQWLKVGSFFEMSVLLLIYPKQDCDSAPSELPRPSRSFEPSYNQPW
jgi:hypothetical protein